jgi:hypothetical protein
VTRSANFDQVLDFESGSFQSSIQKASLALTSDVCTGADICGHHPACSAVHHADRSARPSVAAHSLAGLLPSNRVGYAVIHQESILLEQESLM